MLEKIITIPDTPLTEAIAAIAAAAPVNSRQNVTRYSVSAGHGYFPQEAAKLFVLMLDSFTRRSAGDRVNRRVSVSAEEAAKAFGMTCTYEFRQRCTDFWQTLTRCQFAWTEHHNNWRTGRYDLTDRRFCLLEAVPLSKSGDLDSTLTGDFAEYLHERMTAYEPFPLADAVMRLRRPSQLNLAVSLTARCRHRRRAKAASINGREIIRTYKALMPPRTRTASLVRLIHEDLHALERAGVLTASTDCDRAPTSAAAAKAWKEKAVIRYQISGIPKRRRGGPRPPKAETAA